MTGDAGSKHWTRVVAALLLIAVFGSWGVFRLRSRSASEATDSSRATPGPVGRLEITVRDADGRPVKDAPLLACLHPGTRAVLTLGDLRQEVGRDNDQSTATKPQELLPAAENRREAKTDDAGKAVFDAIPVGSADVQLLDFPSSGYSRLSLPETRVNIVAGETAQVAFSLKPILHVVGTLVDENDRPVTQAKVGARYKLKDVLPSEADTLDAILGRGPHVEREEGEEWTQAEGRFDVVLRYRNRGHDGGPGGWREPWNPGDPTEAGSVRVAASLKDSDYCFLFNMTRPWKAGNTLDLGRIVVKIPPERVFVVKGTGVKGEERKFRVVGCTDQDGRDVPCETPETKSGNYLLASEARIRVRSSGIVKIRLCDAFPNEAGHVVELSVPAGNTSPSEPFIAKFSDAPPQRPATPDESTRGQREGDF